MDLQIQCILSWLLLILFIQPPAFNTAYSVGNVLCLLQSKQTCWVIMMSDGSAKRRFSELCQQIMSLFSIDQWTFHCRKALSEWHFWTYEHTVFGSATGLMPEKALHFPQLYAFMSTLWCEQIKNVMTDFVTKLNKTLRSFSGNFTFLLRYYSTFVNHFALDWRLISVSKQNR